MAGREVMTQDEMPPSRRRRRAPRERIEQENSRWKRRVLKTAIFVRLLASNCCRANLKRSAARFIHACQLLAGYT